MPPDHRDIALECFALVELELLDQIESLECDVAAYRVLTQECLAALAKLTAKHDRLRDAHIRLLEELRARRGQRREAPSAMTEEAA